MICRIGYLMRGFKQVLKTYIPAITILFADSTKYTSDNNELTADNNSNVV